MDANSHLRGRAGLNVVLNAVLIFGFGLGVVGAAIGTVFASIVVTATFALGMTTGNIPGIGAFPLEERKQIVSEVTNDLFHLKNSVEKHRPNEEWAAIRERIATTKQRIRHLAWQVEQLSSPKTATYLRKWFPSMVMFAEAAMDGFEVPWISNPVERAMGEISKRCKHQWMRWTATELEALLQLRLAKYADPDQYQAFKHDLLQRSTKTTISCDFSVEATRSKL